MKPSGRPSSAWGQVSAWVELAHQMLPRPVEHRIVGAGQPLAADLRDQGLVFAGGRIEPLQRPLFLVVDAEVGDQHPALQVHVDAVGRAALRSHAGEGPVRMNLGHGALVVGGEHPAVLADDHILRAGRCRRRSCWKSSGFIQSGIWRRSLCLANWSYQNRSGGPPSSISAIRRRVPPTVALGRARRVEPLGPQDLASRGRRPHGPVKVSIRNSSTWSPLEARGRWSAPTPARGRWPATRMPASSASSRIDRLLGRSRPARPRRRAGASRACSCARSAAPVPRRRPPCARAPRVSPRTCRIAVR
jgi:hypothetical protein